MSSMSSENKKHRNIKKVISLNIESNQKKTEMDAQVTTTISSYNNVKEKKKKKDELTEGKNCMTYSNDFYKYQPSYDSLNTFYKTRPEL